MDTVSKFLEFWDGKSGNPDPLRKLAIAYWKQDNIVTALKKEARELIEVGKDTRGRWIPIFGAGKTDEASRLGARLEEANAKLESIRNDIIEAVGLAGDMAGAHINQDIYREKCGIVQANVALKNEMRRAIRTGADVATAPLVVAARDHLEKLEVGRADAIADLERRRARIDEIVLRY